MNPEITDFIVTRDFSPNVYIEQAPLPPHYILPLMIQLQDDDLDSAVSASMVCVAQPPPVWLVATRRNADDAAGNVFRDGFTQPGNWDLLKIFSMADETYVDPCSPVAGLHKVSIRVDARRVFRTDVLPGNDTNPDNFYVQLRFSVKTTLTTTDGAGVTTTTISSYKEYFDLPNGIFIRSTLNIYTDAITSDDVETFISDYEAGAAILPPG